MSSLTSSPTWRNRLAVVAMLVVFKVMVMVKQQQRRKTINSLAVKGKYSMIIIGAGVGGIAAAKKAIDVGLTEITLFDTYEDFGGTWLQNAYPDAACDVPIAAYSFSFSQRANWSRKWAKRPEILQYVQQVARQELNLGPKTHFSTRVNSCYFDGSMWHVNTTHLITGETKSYQATFLLGATGQLNVPTIPSSIENFNAFAGQSFHTARWPKNVSLKGKKVACIGTGASAIQALPQIAPEVKELHVFQRSAGFIVEKNDYEYPWWATLLLHFPFARNLYRYYLLAVFEVLWYFMVPDSAQKPTLTNQILQRVIQMQMRTHTSKPNELVPAQETIGCKRLLISDDWLPMFERENVKLIQSSIVKIDDAGKTLVCSDGSRHAGFDVLIFATGFDTSTWLNGIEVSVHGFPQTLHEFWKQTPAAYLGISVPHFPNFGLIYGPNTNVNHTSVLALMECALDHYFIMVEKIIQDGAKSFVVKQQVYDEYKTNEYALLAKSVFASDCNSWYRSSRNAPIVNNFHGSLVGYWWQTRFGWQWNDYDVC